MALRRPSNGRSPLVNPQRQITSFFSKSPPPPPPTSQSPSQSNPNPNTKPKPNTTTPSPLQTSSSKKNLNPKRKLPLVIGKLPSPSPVKYGDEVVNRRIRVYWPMDKSWYEGCVKLYDESTGKHLVQYDDSENMELRCVPEINLRKERK